MRVLLVNAFHWLKGGVERTYLDESRWLAAAGHEVLHFATRDARNLPSPTAEFFAPPADYGEGAPLARQLGQLPRAIWSVPAARAMRRLLAAHRPDVAHLHAPSRYLTPSILGPLARAGVPVVMTLHDFKPWCTNRILFAHGEPCERCRGGRHWRAFATACVQGSRAKSAVGAIEAYAHQTVRAYGTVRRWIAPSRFVLDKAAEHGVPRASLRLLGHGVEPRAAAAPDAGTAVPEGPYVLYAGRLSVEKGVRLLPPLAMRIAPVPVLIAGEGPLRGWLAAAAGSLPNLRVLGHVPDATLDALRAAAAVVVVPSLFYEHFCYAAAEALADARPVVASAIGAIPELVRPGDTGLLVPPGDAHALAEAVQRALADPAARVWGEAGRARVARAAAPSAHREGLLAIYGEVIRPGGAGRSGGNVTMMLLVAALLAPADPPRAGVAPPSTAPADLVVRNAAVHTMTSIRTRATAFAVRDGRFAAVGGEADVRPLVGPATRVLDLRGRTVLPGLIDSHGHMLGLGGRLSEVDVTGTRSYEAVVAKVAVSARATPRGGWIQGRGWDQNDWPRTAMPHHAALSRAVPDHPVRITRIDGHALLVNRRALEVAGITRETRDPPGGEILRDAAGEPTGVLIDRAMDLVSAVVPPLTPAERERRLLLAMRECARLGLTMVHDASISEEDMHAYRALLERGEFPIRIYAMARATRDGGDLADVLIARGAEVGDRLTLRAVKVSVDGALGSRGALLTEPYADQPGHRGLPVFPLEKLRTIATSAAAAGIQVRVHAIGDSAVRGVLDAFEHALGPRGSPEARWAIEHAQTVRPDDLPRFSQLSVVASVQPTHATSDGPWVERRLGPERVRWGYTWRSFLDANVAIASGSDFPVESANPMLGLYAAVTRRDLDGRLPAAGWFPEQRLTPREALKSFTLDGAWLAFREGDLGAIDLGRQADFVVIDRDVVGGPAAEIPRAKVLMTVVGGKTEFEALK